jgi:hypothetical protein
MWGFVSSEALSPNRSDPAGEGLAAAFSAIYVAAIWILLALALGLAGARGGMPAWSLIPAFVVHPLSCGVALAVVGGSRKNRTRRRAAVLLAPPLLAAYAFCAFFPALRAEIPPGAGALCVWGAVLAASLISWKDLADFSSKN